MNDDYALLYVLTHITVRAMRYAPDPDDTEERRKKLPMYLAGHPDGNRAIVLGIQLCYCK